MNLAISSNPLLIMYFLSILINVYVFLLLWFSIHVPRFHSIVFAVHTRQREEHKVIGNKCDFRFEIDFYPYKEATVQHTQSVLIN